MYLEVMGSAMVLTDFGNAGQVLVSQHDHAELRRYSWRLDSLGYVVRNEGRTRVTLAREVARMAGLGSGRVHYLDGDPLNCTRGNLYVRGRNPERLVKGGPGSLTGGHLHPYGVHRRAQTQDGTSGGPPPGWVLVFHAGMCRFSKDRKVGCLLARGPGAVIIGTAERLAPNGYGTRWEFAGPSGRKVFDGAFYEGCEFLLRSYLLSLVPAGVKLPDARAALLYQLLGIRRIP